MDEKYWELFCATGSVVFYLLYRREVEREVQDEALTAWADREAELL